MQLLTALVHTPALANIFDLMLLHSHIHFNKSLRYIDFDKNSSEKWKRECVYFSPILQ